MREVWFEKEDITVSSCTVHIPQTVLVGGREGTTPLTDSEL
jgi:hypothetical protein